MPKKWLKYPILPLMLLLRAQCERTRTEEVGFWRHCLAHLLQERASNSGSVTATRITNTNFCLLTFAEPNKETKRSCTEQKQEFLLWNLWSRLPGVWALPYSLWSTHRGKYKSTVFILINTEVSILPYLTVGCWRYHIKSYQGVVRNVC